MNDSTITQRVQAMGIVAERLGFELASMRGRGFSVEMEPHAGEWTVTWMGRPAFKVDLVLKKSWGLITQD
tara:strand:- start:68 stop:277 length:210 start_codon:yes stop_codon:yes gene_type:complete